MSDNAQQAPQVERNNRNDINISFMTDVEHEAANNGDIES